MTFTPHAHQVRMIDEAREATLDHAGVVLQSPTGSGKTVMAAWIMASAAAKGRRTMITVHRDFLIDQTATTLVDVGLSNFGVVASGVTPDPRPLVQIAGIDTLKNRLERVPVPDLLLIDEGHHCTAAGWAKVIKFYKDRGCKVILLTATPQRLDGRGLNEHASHMVLGPTVRWLIDHGFLCDYEAYVPSLIDMSGVHTKMGDFDKAESETLVDKPSITGDAIREYATRAPGKRGVAFCISIKHSEHVCAQFNAAGVPAAHIDGTTEKAERRRILKAFRAGEIHMLTSVNIFGEGFDLPAVEVAILLRPTQSLSLHLQQIGRALRVSPGKERALILDHVGNLLRLGLPDSDFEWSMEGRKKRKKKGDEPSVFAKQCEGCYRVFWPPPTCPYCGHVHQVVGREIEEREGELVKLTPEAIAAVKKAKKVEVWKAQSLEDLERIEAARGYKPGWARAIWSTKQNAVDRRVEAQARAYGRLTL